MGKVNKLSQDQEQFIIDRILHILDIYPIISPTMLQGGLGPQLKPKVWRPVLLELIERDIVIESKKSCMTPAGRYNTYVQLSLEPIDE